MYIATLRKLLIVSCTILQCLLIPYTSAARSFKLKIPEPNSIVTAQQLPAGFFMQPYIETPLPYKKEYKDVQTMKRTSIAHIAMGSLFLVASGVLMVAGKQNEDDSFINTSPGIYALGAASGVTGVYFLTKGIVVNIKSNRKP